MPSLPGSQRYAESRATWNLFSRPRLARGGAEVEDVMDLFLAGEPVDSVATEFGLSRTEVEDVLRASARPAA